MNNWFKNLRSWFATTPGRLTLVGVGLVAVLSLVAFNQQLAGLFNLFGSQADTGHTIVVNADPQSQNEHSFFAAGFSARPDQANCFKTESGRLMLNSACPYPKIASVSPTSGPAGQTVVISSPNDRVYFTQGAIVKFGQIAASVLEVTNHAITVTAPEQADGTQSVNVSVTLPGGGTATLATAYAYTNAPSVLLITPNSGFAEEVVTVSGVNFVDGATVKFGSITATNVQFLSEGQLVVSAPAGGQGTVHVTVTNPDGQTSAEVNTDRFTYHEPI